MVSGFLHCREFEKKKNALQRVATPVKKIKLLETHFVKNSKFDTLKTE